MRKLGGAAEGGSGVHRFSMTYDVTFFWAMGCMLVVGIVWEGLINPCMVVVFVVIFYGVLGASFA